MLPTGTVTFLFTDIEASTRLLERLGEDAYDVALDAHHRILRNAIAADAGVEVSTEGDGFFVVFVDASDAVAAALAAQRALSGFAWPADGAVRVRMGLHTGVGRLSGDNYAGLAVHQAARICSAANGGQVVVSETTREATAMLPEGSSWHSLGRHRLKDLGAPVELHQLCHPDLAADPPPLRSMERVAHNLPIQASSFLGRQDELDLGAKMLAATRLLSVVGPGGTGKTRLAYQLAAQQLHEFPDGVWVAELASVSDAEGVPGALMTALSLRDEPGRSATETIAAFLHHRRTLVVFDNCEHLVEPAARLCTELLRDCANLRFLATSRERLRVAGESVWALEPLSLPEGDHRSLEVLAGVDAVSLFCERAAEADMGFALSADNAGAVTAICTRLEGIPLAIELAAARVRSLPLVQIAERLSRNLDLLSKGMRGTEDRQASLRHTIGWSYELLSAAEQTLFRSLSVFAGGFTLEAAEGVCVADGLEVGEIIDLLDALVDKSLVALVQDGGDGRYRLLETIRAYAAERLRDAGEEPSVAARHAEFYACLAHDSVHDTVALVTCADADHPNLLAALDHLAGSDRPVTQGHLVTDLFWFWDLRGHWQLARQQLLRYLRLPDRDRSLEGACVGYLGHIAFNLGDYPEARARYEQALTVARELGDRRREATWVGNLGHVAFNLGDYPEARARVEDALAIARDLGDRQGERAWINGLGDVAFSLGDYPEARARLEEALVIARELGDCRGEGRLLGALGNVALNIGNSRDARAQYEHALAIARDLGDRHSEASWVGKLGLVASDLRDYPDARDQYERALAIARDLGDRHSEATWVGNLGLVACDLGDLREARVRIEEALVIARELGTEDNDLLVGSAQLVARLNQCEDAVQLLAAADTLDFRSHRVRGRSAQARCDASLAACEKRLSEEALTAATSRGGSLDWPDAAALALEALDRRLPIFPSIT